MTSQHSFPHFQDHADCPARTVRIFVQQGSYPVFSGDGTPLPPFYYLERTSPSNLTVSSEFQPDGSVVHAVYNPLPGSWFAVAYLESYEEPHGLSRKCRWVEKPMKPSNSTILYVSIKHPSPFPPLFKISYAW